MIHLFDTREKWLSFRQNGVGGSDAPVIAGLVAWSSPYKLALQKRGLAPEEEESVRMSLGRVIEPWARQRLMEETGWQVQHNEFGVHQSETQPWMFCTPDGIITASDRSGPGVNEIKSVGYVTKEALEDPDSDERRVWDTQMQHSLSVTGFAWGAVAVVIGNANFRWYVAERDEKRIAEIIALESTFWTNLQNGVYPDVDGSEATEHAIRRRFKTPNGKPVALSQESVVDFEEWEVFTRLISEADVKAARAKNRLMSAMGNNSFATLPNGVKLTWKGDGRGARVLRRMK